VLGGAWRVMTTRSRGTGGSDGNVTAGVKVLAALYTSW
jgi:hypothetical protein